jgi:hypothetical protein
MFSFAMIVINNINLKKTNMQEQAKIKCPKCGYEIDVQNVLSHEIEARIRKEMEDKYALEKKQYEEQVRQFLEEKEAFEEKKLKEAELFNEKLAERIEEEKKNLKEKIKKTINKEKEEQFSQMQQELNEKSEKLKELNKSKAEIERLKREKDELKDEIEANALAELNKKLAEEKEKIRKQEADKNQFAIKELQKQLEDQKKLTEEMKRKQEQGSMQLQGEVQELAIEEWLNDKFPLDTIKEIKKGVRGADCLQIVHTRNRQNCGTIYYESKRTKDFQQGWIEKFKNDIRDKGADIGVLVTEAMPADMERMGLKDGIWICSFDEFKGLSLVLRESIIQISNAVVSQENKGDKMSLLYDFLTSNEFRMQIEAIVEGFNQMKADLEKEKRSMTGMWKRREKQIEKVLLNTNHMYNSIKGIAGNAVQTVNALEMPEGDTDE